MNSFVYKTSLLLLLISCKVFGQDLHLGCGTQYETLTSEKVLKSNQGLNKNSKYGFDSSCNTPNQARINYGAINLECVVFFDETKWNLATAKSLVEDVKSEIINYNIGIHLTNSDYHSSSLLSTIKFTGSTSHFTKANDLKIPEFQQELTSEVGIVAQNKLFIVLADSLFNRQDSGIGGRAVFPWDYDLIGSEMDPRIVFVSIEAFDTKKTLIHELGHAFGLYHTFQGDFDPNKIYDCSVSDLIEDTPNYDFDPSNVDVINELIACLDNGDLELHPDNCSQYTLIDIENIRRNYMGYLRHNSGYFSTLQNLKMYDFLSDGRFFDLCATLPIPSFSIDSNPRNNFDVHTCSFGTDFLIESILDQELNSNTNNIVTWYYVNPIQFLSGEITFDQLPIIKSNSVLVKTDRNYNNSQTSEGFNLGIGYHLIAFRDEAPYNHNCSSEFNAFGIIVTDEEQGCAGYSNNVNAVGSFLKSNSNISNVTANVTCNPSSYNANITFSAPSNGNYSIIAEDGINVYAQLNSATPNSSNTFSNIPNNKTLFINVIDNNIDECQYNHVMVNNDLCSVQNSSINLEASTNSTSYLNIDPIIINGNVTYNTGHALINGNIQIEYAGSLWNTTTDNSGDYGKVIPASVNDNSIKITATDGLLTSVQNVSVTVNTSAPTSYTIYDHVLSPSMEGSHPSVARYYYRSDMNAVYSWMVINNVDDDLNVQWDYIRPDGTVAYTKTEFLADANGGSYNTWSWMDLEGSSNVNHPGKWFVKVHIKKGTTFKHEFTETFYLSYEFDEYKMSNDSDPSKPFHSLSSTNTFYTDEGRAFSFVLLRNYSEALNFRTVWKEPNGLSYTPPGDITSYTSPDPGYNYHQQTWSNGARMGIRNKPAALKTGNWKALTYIKTITGAEVLAATQNFEILERPSIKPQAYAVLGNSNPSGNVTLTVNYSAADNTYLNKVIMYWRSNSGNWNSQIVSNINDDSWNLQKNIGAYAEGTKVDFYLTAIDNSGNSKSSALGTVTILDDDVFPPNISNMTVSEFNGNDDGVIDDQEQFEVCATVQDGAGLSDVTFTIDGVEVTLVSYYCGVFGPISQGAHTFMVSATDSDNSPMTSSQSITFNVSGSCLDHLTVTNSNKSIYQSGQTLTTSRSVHVNSNQNIQYKSQTVSLKPGLHIEPGSVFRAHVDPCNN